MILDTRYLEPSPKFIAIERRNASSRHLGFHECDIRLPVELWLEILKYLAPSSLRAVTTTCAVLRWLAQPFLFKLFTVRLHTTAVFPHNIRREARPVDTKARLGALSVSYIANSIEELRIVPTGLSSVTQTCISGPLAQPDEDIIDIIFNAFPLLVNLKRLVCHDVNFTLDRLLALRRVPQLRDLELQSCYTTCKLDTFPDFSSMSLETLIIDYPYSSLDFFRNHHFIALFLQSRKLKRIFSGPANDIVFAITQTQPPKTLTALEIPVSCIASPVFIPALSMCPTVKELSLHMVQENNRLPPLESIPPEVLPELRSYCGPRAYAPLFTRDRDVAHVEITQSCQPDDLSETILGLDADIESLSCKVHHLDAPLLETIHHTFPSLRHLAVSGTAVDIDGLSSILDIAKVHKSLTSIQLTVTMGLPRLTSAWRAIAARMFLTRLIQSYPVLQTAKLTYQPAVSVVWQRPHTTSRAVIIDPAELWIEKQDDLLRKANNLWDILKIKR